MSYVNERFNREEMARPRHSPQLAILLSQYFSQWESVYDFGCGDGYYLKEISARVHGRCVGLEGAKEIPDQKFPWIFYPIDVATPFRVGPPGNVMSIEVAEHISAERIPGLLENINRHCRSKLVLSWAVRGQAGIRHISCRNEDEVMKMIIPMGFNYLEDLSKTWREQAGEDLWWFKQTIYIFERK